MQYKCFVMVNLIIILSSGMDSQYSEKKIYAWKLNALESKVDLNVHWKLSTIPSVH